ncbi:hypothetical protein A3L09_07520 [Thermococcus profundus]|uniref:Uncharacterized protein n=1 Tax=Thermococcus profundus TaxID=49899 RepID=A0A2Z2MC71_THEPR|nr:hypothetical protein [Thermococcus profundus]ASJ03113.1 hypothetical protein A3L09_07520 [Thermococcus profundus]
MDVKNPVESAKRLIQRGMLDDAYEFFKILPEDLLNGELEPYVVETAEHFAKTGDIGKALNVAYLLDGEHFEWAVYRAFSAYLWEGKSTERARRALELHYIIPDPEDKVGILRRIAGILGKEEPELARMSLRLGIGWARRINKRADRYDAFEGLYWRAEELEDWESVRRICKLLDDRGRRELVMDVLDLDEGDPVPDCEEFIEIRRNRSEDEDALGILIRVYKEHERELLRSRGVNPYLYKLKARKTEDGVQFYAVRRPITVAVLLYLLDKGRKILTRGSS